MLILTFPFCLPFVVKIAKEYEKSVIFRLGRLLKTGTKGPGLYFVIPCIDTVKTIDLRVLSFDVPARKSLFVYLIQREMFRRNLVKRFCNGLR